MNTVTLQVPINKNLRDRATTVAEKMGFSSLQEAVRVFLNKMAKGQLDIQFEEPTVQLSPKAIKRYDKMMDEVESGKVKPVGPFTDIEEMMEYLHEGKLPH